MRIRVLLTAGGACLLLVGCSSTSKPAPIPSPPLATHYGEHALEVAKPDSACRSLHFSGPGVADGMIDTAECTLMGEEVTFYTWASAKTQAEGSSFFGDESPYWADGIGWSAIIDEHSAPLATRKAIAEQLVSALGGKVEYAAP